MPRPDRIIGLAIVSADHMIADADGIQPEALKPEADQRFFYGTLDGVDAVAHGRNSAEGGDAAARRRRLVLTRKVAAIEPHPENERALCWNPAGADLDAAWSALGLSGGTLAVVGGTETFDLFLRLGYDTFHLTRVAQVRLPGGRLMFNGLAGYEADPNAPDALLRGAGLRPQPVQVLDPGCELTLTTWTR